MIKTALVALVSLVFSVAVVQAQCAADANLDGRVSANEVTRLVLQQATESYLSTSVADVFNPQCENFCRLTFRDSTDRAGYSCVYSGTAYNSHSPSGVTCQVEGIQATWTSDGANIIVTFLNVLVAPFPGAQGSPVHFGAVVSKTNPRRASLAGWWTDADSHIIPASGVVTIAYPLVVNFSVVPFQINKCSLYIYGGEFVGYLP